jgi:5-methylcytosine-specific restriction endonuclease McrA
VLKAARKPYDGTDKRTKWVYRCAVCGNYFKSTEVSVDHIVPAGKLSSYEDMAGFAERLFVGVDGLQVLCTADHSAKTLKERSEK